MNFWEGKNIFVTGGTGFIGTWLVKELVDKGANVCCLVKEYPKESNFLSFNLDKKTNLIFGDMLDIGLIKLCLEKYGIDTVFHLAAQPLVQIALKNPLETIETNVMGTLNILESCRLNQNVKRIVVASSDKAYGSSDKLPYDETFSLKGSYPYDVSKSCTDLVAQAYGKTYNMPVAITRFSNVYGGGDLNFDRIIPETIKHILHNEEILIRSNGKFTREFFYVKDAANAYITLAEKIQELNLKGEAFNFGTDKPVIILDLVKKIIEVSDKKDSKIKIQDIAKAEIKDQYLSSEKARKILNWEPNYSLEEGLKETYIWYKNYFKK
ncbi:MAG: GDP-mannose 4,6-dehydratase [Candidatus Nanoarchaeia archaeon]